MFTLRLIFIGLIAFVPQYNADQQLTAIWGLGVNGQDINTIPAPTGCTPQAECVNVHPHHAALRVPLKNLKGGYASGGEGILMLDGRELSMQFGGGSTPSAITAYKKIAHDQEKPKDPCSDGFGKYCDRWDIHWIPKMSKVAPLLATIHPDCLKALPQPDLGARLASRVKLEYGLFGAKSVPENVVWEFRPKKGDYRQSHSEEVMVQIDKIAGEVTLKLTSFKDPSDVVSLTLAGSAGETIEVEMVNVDAGYIMPGVLPAAAVHSPELNFLWFYKLSANNLGPFPAPVATVDRGGKPYCTQVFFQ